MKLTQRIRDILKEKEEEAYKFGNVDELNYITSVFNDVIIIEQKLKQLRKEKEMNIELKDTQIIQKKEETHYKIIINGKEVWVNKWFEYNEFEFEGATDFIKGQELLTEEEQEAILDYVNEELANKGV